MKYKLIGLGVLAAAAAVAVTVSAVIPEDSDTRYIEHRDAEEKSECTLDHNGELCTHLPILVIDTGGEDIPGLPIYDENGVHIDNTTAADGEKTITAAARIIDNDGTYNHVSDTAALSSTVEVRIRGNSSRSFDKPGYFIRLVDGSGLNAPQEVMGMEAHHEWALHGPYLDKTLIRNYMWYNIAGEIMDYAPNVRFCEVVLNGEYRGLYLMCETVTAGKDGARLSLEVNKKDNTFAGYILRLDRGDVDEEQNIYPFTSYTLRVRTRHEVVYPGLSNLTEAFGEEIKDEFSLFEKSLYSFDFDSSSYGYKAFVDTDSFVDYFVINEIAGNYDAGLFSTYIYKEPGGKYRMCVWDFNSACDMYQETGVGCEGLRMQNYVWYVMMCRDSDFCDAVIKRYRELRKTYFSDEYIDAFIDDTIAYLGDAVERNYAVWGYSFEKEHDLLIPASRNVRSYDEAVAQMRGWLHERLCWLDENIETLRQYGAQSKVKKFTENAS